MERTREYRKRTAEVRDKLLTIRISKTEREKLSELADMAGVTVGGYLLGCALGNQPVKAVLEQYDPDQMRLDV